MNLDTTQFCYIVWVWDRMGVILLCVSVLSSHLFWTSGLWTYQPGSHWRKVTQDFLFNLPSAVFALIFLARRIQPLLSLLDREVDFLCTDELIVLHL